MATVNQERGLKETGRFVVHRHEARRLHYDLRLEREGVLKSWAVPKGMPESPGVKRLAVRVEDHSLDYFGFEGTIPEGQYGAGKVEVWDSGTYVEESWGKDRITVEFNGKKLSGRYALVRFMEKNWLVVKLRPRDA
ncbi:MAG: ATP-dependent DNA ligase [Deltaproteobacteria bacterium]|nr:ATP-dependent DNA ligase [Deltaproteobacteria bacterium]MBZ0220116.1 ATP-dependent DNA ligase [Deltaproteobacteria bacterium]